MKSLETILSALKKTAYLEGTLETQNQMKNIKLLPNGLKYCEEILQQWQDIGKKNIGTSLLETKSYKHLEGDADKRLGFLQSAQLKKNLKKICSNHEVQCPITIKSIYQVPTNLRPDTKPTKSNPPDFLFNNNSHRTQLIIEHFCHTTTGLEKFYNIQRERKIWWMRFSANPSRYSLEAYNFREYGKPHSFRYCQSIDIKTHFSFGGINVEHITLLPLEKLDLECKENFLMKDKRTRNQILPTVIRSVIHLEKAACAMLFDAYDHNRHSLQLNRKLAPFQCSITCLYKGKEREDLCDLCLYLNFVIRRAGLRLLCDPNAYTTSKEAIQQQWQAADDLGIPYTLLVEEDTLRTGLLKLRSRDTTLEETIHISDIPGYLLNIFTH